MKNNKNGKVKKKIYRNSDNTNNNYIVSYITDRKKSYNTNKIKIYNINNIKIKPNSPENYCSIYKKNRSSSLKINHNSNTIKKNKNKLNNNINSNVDCMKQNSVKSYSNSVENKNKIKHESYILFLFSTELL